MPTFTQKDETTFHDASQLPAQSQKENPALQKAMKPQPIIADVLDEATGKLKPYTGCDKLKDKVALITGGDSGIGRSVAVLFAREGAQVAIVFLDYEMDDAKKTAEIIKQDTGREALLIAKDIGYEKNCQEIVRQVVDKFGKLDILVNNAGEQHTVENIEDMEAETIERTFRTNILSMFYLTKASVPHMKAGSTIINTASVNAYRGMGELLDYSSTKGAIVGFTRSLAKQLAAKKIRVNGVAPGPISTPFIPGEDSFGGEGTEKFTEMGKSLPLGRVGQPVEVATAYVFLASNDSSYFTGQFLHPNGGEVVNS